MEFSEEELFEQSMGTPQDLAAQKFYDSLQSEKPSAEKPNEQPRVVNPVADELDRLAKIEKARANLKKLAENLPVDDIVADSLKGEDDGTADVLLEESEQKIRDIKKEL